MTAVELAGFLEDWGGATRDPSDVRAYLNGTPLVARTPGGQPFRGADLDPGARVLASDAGRAESDLRSFVAEGIALFGGLAHVRVPGPTVATFSVTRGRQRDRLLFCLTSRGRSETLLGDPADPEAFCEAVFGWLDPDTERDRIRVRAEAAALPGVPPGVPHGAMHFAHRAPAEFATACLHYLGLPEIRGEAGADPIREIHARLGAGIGQATLGSLRPYEAEQAVADVARLADLLFDALPRASANDRLNGLATFARRYALPRLRADAPALDEDLEALASAFPAL